MFAKDDFDAVVEEMTGGGIKGNSFLNSFTGGQGLTGLLKNQAKKFGVNQGLKALTGGSGSGIAGGIPLIGAALGLGYMTNPLREGSYNYNPNLQGQLNYASSMGNLNRNNSAGLLRYDGNSVLAGQNAVSGFGTNDYGKQLQNYIDKMETRKTKGYNTIGIGPFQTKTTNFTAFQQSQLDKAKTELEALTTNDFNEVDKFMKKQTPTKTKTNNNGSGNGGGSGSFDNSKSGKEGAFGTFDGSRGRKDYGRGGIVSLWQR